MSLRIQVDSEDLKDLSLKVLRALRSILPEKINTILSKKADSSAGIDEKDD